MEINGRSTKDMTHADAIELIKQCGSSVSLLVKRGGKLPQHLGELQPLIFIPTLIFMPRLKYSWVIFQDS